jgi:hypothetical protein
LHYQEIKKCGDSKVTVATNTDLFVLDSAALESLYRYIPRAWALLSVRARSWALLSVHFTDKYCTDSESDRWGIL